MIIIMLHEHRLNLHTPVGFSKDPRLFYRILDSHVNSKMDHTRVPGVAPSITCVPN